MFSKKRTLTSIWNNFTAADDRLTAKCNLCEKIIKTGGGSTSGLHTHMRSIHSLPSNDSPASSASSSSKSSDSGSKPAQSASKKAKLTDYYQSSDSMELIVSRMAALDGIPLSKFCTSEDLRRLFKKSDYNLPSSPATITNIIIKQSDNLKNLLKEMFTKLKTKGLRFTLTFDEYTATNNKRFMNINVHNKDLDHDKYKNLGLVRITGSMSAAVGMQYLKDRLQEFGINLHEDIIAFTTDGASVMTKMGKKFEGYHQLCLAHGIQLAVIDVLYKYKFHKTSSVASSTSTPKTEIEINDSDDDGEKAIEEDSFNLLQPIVLEEPEFIYKNLIEKVRKLVKLFRKSPTKNDLLQRYIVEKHGKEMHLILDCKTRWSSMSDMIGRFLKLKDCVLKVLIDLKLEFSLDEQELQILNDIHNSLAVVKATVLALCKRDANLLTADVALKFMLKKLDERATDLSENLATTLRKRIKERRLLISGVLQYLHDSKTFYNDHDDDDTFKKPTSDENRQIIVSLISRLKYKNINLKPTSSQRKSNEKPSISLIDDSNSENEEISVEKELEKEIKFKCMPINQNASSKSQNTDLDSIIRVEMCVYDNAGGGREVFLTAAYEYLLSVQPTSVEAERAFSSVGYLCNRLRSSLSDKSLNALSFLRSQFQSEKKWD